LEEKKGVGFSLALVSIFSNGEQFRRKEYLGKKGGGGKEGEKEGKEKKGLRRANGGNGVPTFHGFANVVSTRT